MRDPSVLRKLFSARLAAPLAVAFLLGAVLPAGGTAEASEPGQGAAEVPAAVSPPAPAPAVSPGVLNYQGRFTDTSGTPMAGPIDLVFRLFVLPSGGSVLWTEEHTGVELQDGVASVLLGSLVSFPENAFSAAQRYLEIEVNGTVLSPRLAVTSVPYALEADRLDGREAGSFEPAGTAAALADSLRLPDGTPVNEGSNRVSWMNLNDVPPGFADAVDDTGHGVTDHGQLTGLLDDDHPQYMLRSDLQTSDGDPPNEGSDFVSWNNLTDVPSGFADGVDNTGSGSGGPVTGADIVDSTITAVDLADSTVTGVKVAPSTLTGGHLEAGTVTARELAPGAVTGAAIEDLAVTGSDVADQSLTGQKLADRTVTGDKVALETITGENITDDSVRSADILDGTLTTNDVKDSSLTAADLASNSVTTKQIADGTIQPEDMGFTVGDVTGVSVAGGLSGGGQSGDITLAVGAGQGIQVIGSTVGLTPTYFSGSAFDGRFVSQASPNWLPLSASVVVSGAAFRPVTPVGKYTVVPTGGYVYVDSLNNVGAQDKFTAPIQIPDGAQITGFYVTYWDNSAAILEVALWRALQTDGSPLKIASVTSQGQSTGWKTDNDATIAETGVDDDAFVYWLVADFPSTPQGDLLRVLSVRVTYTVSRPH
jgi:hypothetical protein